MATDGNTQTPEENIIEDLSTNEWFLVAENPLDFSDDIQRKYFWVCFSEYQRVSDYSWEVWVFEKLENKSIYDPFAKEYYNVLSLVSIDTEARMQIKIPMSIISNVKEKIETISFMFSALERYPEWEYLVLDNILLKYVPLFLSEAEYIQLSTLGVVFDDNIKPLFDK